MKVKSLSGKNIFRLLVLLFFGVTLATACKKDSGNNNTQPYTLSGNANGSQVVPSNTGTGTGTITGNYNPTTGTLSYTSTWTGLSGAPTSGGFYSGAAGTAGMAIGSPFSLGTTPGNSGSTSGTMTLTSDQANQLIAGNWYYSYSTSIYPGGEVRGQISVTR
jgi:hypothetical protein